MAKAKSKKQFRFKRNMKIGAMDAYEDEKYLSKCFVDTGDVDYLLDTNESKCIIVARTGAGKSALLERIKKQEDNIITLLPNELALNYIANSNVIRFFENIGIKLDIFYQLLWRHVLAVELIRKKFNITNESSRNSFLERISNIFANDESKKQAIAYLMEWGDKFWLEAGKRIKELTTKLEDELSASIDLKGLGIPLTVAGSDKLSSEVKEEVIQRAQNVVNSVQIQKLNHVIKLLSEDIFTDPQQRYYILIDRLDDEWIDDPLRYRLIRALIETVKTLKKIEPVKAIISLRSDLINIVFQKTRDSGFQEEKYEDFILRLTWEKDDLYNLLDKRVSMLIEEQYTSHKVGFHEVFTSKPNGKKPIEYILERTFMRPRDAISFVNLCLEKALGKDEINTTAIKEAERVYSKKRLDALCHEWFASYPLLEKYIYLVKSKKNGFNHSDIDDTEIDEMALALCESHEYNHDPVKQIAIKMFEPKATSKATLRNNILKTLYSVGALGVKKASYTSVSWSQDDEPTISESEIKNSTRFEVHPMFYSALGIDSRTKK